MTPTRLLTAALVAATALTVAPAEAKPKPKPKPMSGSYDLQLPVPYAMESSDGSHCRDAPDTVSKHEKRLTVPWAGTMTFTLSRTVGDWVIELHDSKGALLAYGASSDPLATSRTLKYKKKSSAKQTYVVMVCNYAGGPNGHVDWKVVPA